MNHPSEFLDLTQRTVLGLLAQNLFGSPFTPPAETEWEAVLRESKAQAVAMQTFANHHKIPDIPEPLRKEIQTYLLKSLLHNTRILGQHTYLHKLMLRHNIPYVTLKGAASAYYYPDPQTRMMGDVDFYVDKANFSRAIDIFREDGFEIGDLDHICHVVLRKGQIHMEMHHTPTGVPNGKIGEIVLDNLAGLPDEAFLSDTKTFTCYCPSQFHHGLITLTHMQHHMLAEGIGLRHLCDWAVFVSHFHGNEFPSLFSEELKAIGLWRFARLLSLCATLYLGLPEQAWMLETADDTQTASALMQDIFTGGNFGQKDRQRQYEGLFISDRGKDGVQNHALREGIRSLNRITRFKYPVVEKCPVLLPFCWLPAFGGYMIRTHRRNLQGKNIHTLDAYRKSTHRIRLYQKLALYEPEK